MTTLLLIAVLVLPVVYLLGFAGCSSFTAADPPPSPTPTPTPTPT